MNKTLTIDGNGSGKGIRETSQYTKPSITTNMTRDINIKLVYHFGLLFPLFKAA